MSLSRILNNESSPGPPATQTYAGSAPVSAADNVLTESPSPSTSTPVLRPQGTHPDHRVEQHPPGGYSYRSPTIQSVWSKDPYRREWAHGDTLLLDPNDLPSLQEVQEPSVGSYHKDSEVDSFYRKRRKGPDEDADYQPPGQRRVSSLAIFP
jgi:hypothetical protein